MPEIIKVGLSHLKLFDFEVISAYNGQMALEIYQDYHSSIQLIFTDFEMPIMNG